MSDIRLQKVILGPDWLDMSYGEPTVVTQALYKQLNRFGDPFKMPTMQDLLTWTYQPAAGKPDLISILEKKHSGRVVVTNGAKQGLSAACQAMRKHELKTISYIKPYYPANPGIVESSGLTWASVGEADCNLITSPNNPDGKNFTNLELVEWQSKGPMIHDAAYYTDIYLPEDQIPIQVGDIQVFSMSKMYGLSGLRVGYAVCHNEKYYNDMVEYMETSTAGVSTASQDIVRNVENLFKAYPGSYNEFTLEARKAIADAREELKALDPDVLEVVPSTSNSMFAWLKVGPRLDNKSAKVHILPGEIFGQSGMMRMNIAQPVSVVREAVSRLNKHKL